MKNWLMSCMNGQTLGRIETTGRFLHVGLFQGVPKVDSQLVKVRQQPYPRVCDTLLVQD